MVEWIAIALLTIGLVISFRYTTKRINTLEDVLKEAQTLWEDDSDIRREAHENANSLKIALSETQGDIRTLQESRPRRLTDEDIKTRRRR